MRAFNPHLANNMVFFLTPQGREYLQLKSRFNAISKRIVEDRKNMLEKNPDILSDTTNLCFLDCLLTAKYVTF